MYNSAVRCGSKHVQSFAWMSQQYYNVHKFMTILVKILSLLNIFSSVYIILFLVPSKRYGQKKQLQFCFAIFTAYFSLFPQVNAPINVMPAGGGGGGGRAEGGDLTFFKNLQSNALPTGKSFQSNVTKFPHPRLYIAVNPKAGSKKGTIKISPNKTLQSFTAAIIRFNHNPCYTASNT